MKPLHWGIIGCGDVVLRRVGPAFGALENCTVQAVARRDATRLEAGRKALGALRGYDDWRQLLADESVQAVYVATPVNRHAAQVVAAARAGKHVLCEKPLGMSAAECRQMIDVCRACRVQLGVAYYRHYYPAVARIEAIVRSGEIGRVLLACFAAAETFVPAADHPRHWILDKAQAGGGCLMDFGCHRIEVLLHLFGVTRVATGTIGKVYPEHDVEDMATVALAFQGGESGLITVIRGGTEEYDKVFIQATGGTLRIDNLNDGTLTITTETGARKETLPCHVNPHLPLIDAFSAAILAGKPPEVDGRVGRAVQEVIDRIYAQAAI